MSLAYRLAARLKWFATDARLMAALVRRPWKYGRWYKTEQRSRLRDRRRVWVIAADVAQTHVGLKFIEEMRRRHPELSFVFSVCTRAMHRLASKEVSSDDVVTYVPMPLSFVLWRALAMVRPLAIVSVMTIERPNLLWRAKTRGIPVAWIAAEMSDVTASQFERFWQRFELDRFVASIDLLCASTSGDRDRLAALGFAPERIQVMGPAKYSAAIPLKHWSAEARALLDAAGIDEARQILLGASVFEGEDTALLDIYAELKPRMSDLALILAPRDIRGATELVARIEQRGLTALRHSQIRQGAQNGVTPADVLVLDTVGALKSIYAWASVVFLGRTLVGGSGSNVMEPAGYGKAIVMGPRFERFVEPMQDFIAANAVYRVADVAGLRQGVTALLEDSALRAEYGRRAYDVVARNSGALARTVVCLEQRGVLSPVATSSHPSSAVRLDVPLAETTH